MRRVSKRIISLFLVLVMLLAMIPSGTVLASAASGSLDMTAEGLTATYAGDGTWTGGGNVAHGTVTGKGSLFKQSQSGSLTFTNTRSQAGYISFDYKITENTGSVTMPVIPLRAAALIAVRSFGAAVKRFRLLSNPVRVTTKQRRLSLRISILLLTSVPRPPLKHRSTVPIPSTVSLSQRTQPKRSPQR